jgi:hypothetical protein
VSLKALHLFFICLSTLFAFGFGLWALNIDHVRHEFLYFILGVFSFITAILLIIYSVIFLRKYKHISFM